MAEQHVIFSSGAVGMALTEELLYRGHHVTYIDISGANHPYWPFEIKPVVQLEPNIETFAKHATGVTAIYQCFNAFELSKPMTQWPAWQRAIMDWASQNPVTLVVLESLRMMGTVTDQPITTQTLPQPNTAWGEVLYQLSLEFRNHITQQKLPWIAASASDLFGPYLRGGPLGESLFANALAGKKVIAPKELDHPHSFSYVPDIARALMTLGERKHDFGQIWMLPTAKPITLRDFFTLVADHLKKPLALTNLSKTRLRMSAFLNPSQPPFTDAFATFETPFTVHSRNIECAFGLQGTPLKAAITDTMHWFEDEAEPTKKPVAIPTPTTAKKSLPHRSRAIHQGV